MGNGSEPQTKELSAREAGSSAIVKALDAVRSHLGMEIAYLSEFVDGRSVFREISAPGLEAFVKVGDSNALEDVYCQHILDGRLPELIPDTSKNPFAFSMPITAAVPIGSHMSIPPYGIFCCLSTKPNASLNARDLATMRMFADLAAQVVKGLESTAQFDAQRKLIESVISTNAFSIVYQPIYKIGTMVPVGFESLCRFGGQPYRSPDRWFADAADVGLGTDLELTVLGMAVNGLRALPEHCYISFNVSPDTVITGRLAELFDGTAMHRVVIEITEHAPVSDYAGLLACLKPLVDRGARLAVDDAGAGHSSLRHIVQLAPDLIKLDISISRDVDKDRARRSLAAALIYFARETEATIIAEGVETEAELETLRSLGIGCVQGYLLGKPQDLATAVALCHPANAKPGSAATVA